MNLRHLRSRARWLGYRAFPGALVLRYHRVTDLPTDPHATAVKPENFADQLEVLRTRFEPLSLRELVRSLGEGGPPRLGVVVTLDDGYADNLIDAKPLLERYEIPATVFVITGRVGTGDEFWWDQLEAMLLHPGTLPRKLVLAGKGWVLDENLGEDATYSEEDFERNRGWSWRAADDPTARQRLFRALSRRMRRLPEDERREAMGELVEWAGGKRPARSSNLALTKDQLTALADGGLIEIGAHSVTHPELSRLSPDEQRAQIEGSKSFLEEALGAPVSSFAYPYGDVGKSTAVVRAAGFRCACTTRAGVVFRNRDPFRLPRVYAGDWSEDEFERRLRALP